MERENNMLIQAKYHEVRGDIQDGDIIAFGGRGGVSNLIKLFTRSNVSHVALVMKSKLENNVPLNMIIESTILDGYSGVTINRLSNRLKDYQGEVWWLPLRQDLRSEKNWEEAYEWLKCQRKKAYDNIQAIGSGLDLIWNNKEDFDKFFCSELCCAFFEEIEVVEGINSSEVTPIDLCMFSLYENNYYQICGIEKEIKGYNTLEPGQWIM